MIFRVRRRVYRDASAVEVVRALERDDARYPYRGHTIRRFLLWSLGELGGKVPPRELDLSDTVGDEELALSYLYLLDEYDAGEVLAACQESALRRRSRHHFRTSVMSMEKFSSPLFAGAKSFAPSTSTTSPACMVTGTPSSVRSA